MKKTFLLSVAMCLIASTGISAQHADGESVENREKTRFGVKIGGQVSAMDRIHGGSGKRFPGLTVGAMLQIPLQKKEVSRWFFTPELLYSQEGEKDEMKGRGDVKFYHDYLALPLLFKGYFVENRLLYVELGPKLSYAIHQKNKNIDLSKPNKFDVGLSLGGGLSLGANNNFEIGARLNWGLLDMYPDTKKNNFNIGGAVTVAYLFGGDTKAVAEPVVQQAVVRENNEKIAELKEEVKEVAEPKPAPTPTPRPEPVVKPEFTPATVYFDLNKALINTGERAKIDAAAQFLSANPTHSVRLVGFADKATGSAEYNLKISKRRVEAVRDYLIHTGKINANRITTDFEGDKVQPETVNDKNRCVTIYITDDELRK